MSQLTERNRKTGYPAKYHFKLIFTVLIILLFAFGLNPLSAFESQRLLKNTQSKSFKHWNTDKKEITGYTIVTYERDKDNQSFKELSKNLEKDRTIFSEKVLWFTSSGKLIRYEETDLPSKLKTINTYKNGEIETEVWEKEKRTTFSVQSQPGLIPFEVITLHLQEQIPALIKETSIKFKVYLPIVAIELKKGGLPTSLSVFEVSARVSKIKKEKTILGDQDIITIQVKPTSFLLNALLPPEKSVFEFTFLKQLPHDLIMFKEGKTQIILESIDK